jgi:hypothetical protein
MFSMELYAIIPVGSMEQHALVLIQSRNSRPSPIIQDFPCIDQNIATILNLFCSFEILHSDGIPAPGSLDPLCPDDFVFSLDIIIQPMFFRKVLKVLEDLATARINSTPIKFGLKGPGIVMRRYIASTPFFISIPPPNLTFSYPGYLFSSHVPETS